LPDDAQRAIAQNSARPTEVLEVDIDLEQPRQSRQFDNGFSQTRNERRQPAPMTFSDDQSFSSSPARAVGQIDGEKYVVEPNDNFWTISRKRYGAGRFYMALAKHNQHIISDPRMMKPGVVILTPDVAVLEQRYADVIPKAGPMDTSSSTMTTQSRKSSNTELPGYFVDGDGSPMYRIGESDTLTGIAKSHLGRTSRWVQILEMNRNVLRDGNELKIGTVLRLPADASRVQIVGSVREFR
jgi:nucleoid-associated protein YgaU